jgi:hypothetical protein
MRYDYVQGLLVFFIVAYCVWRVINHFAPRTLSLLRKKIALLLLRYAQHQKIRTLVLKINPKSLAMGATSCTSCQQNKQRGSCH